MNAILRDMSKGYAHHCTMQALLLTHSPVLFSCLELGLNYWGGSSHDVSIKCNVTRWGFRRGHLEDSCHPSGVRVPQKPHNAGVPSSCGSEACGDKELKSLKIRLNFLPCKKDKISA